MTRFFLSFCGRGTKDGDGDEDVGRGAWKDRLCADGAFSTFVFKLSLLRTYFGASFLNVKTG